MPDDGSSRTVSEGTVPSQSSAAVSDSLLSMVLRGWGGGEGSGGMCGIAESGYICLFCVDLHWVSIGG